MNAVPTTMPAAPVWICGGFVLLVPFAIAGLALINAGLGRSRSAAHAMTSSLCVISVAVFAFFVFGFSIHGYPALISGFMPTTNAGLFLLGSNFDSISGLAILLAMFSTALAAIIPLGAGADRWRLGAACVSTIVLSGFLFPLMARWSWHGIVLLAGGPPAVLLDAGGSGVVQATGGLTALVIAWLLGPRQGKYPAQGMPAAIPAHNGVFVLFGCMLAWVGWLGLNAAGAMLHSAVATTESALVIVNTTFAAASAALAATATTRIRFRRPDASLIANGWVAGLVASSAGCATVKPAIAIVTGLIAGVLVVSSVEWFELWLKVDDPCGSISVHAVAGIWGILAAGVFAGNSRIMAIQLAGIATLVGFILPVAYGTNWLISRMIPYRVSPEGEGQGLDLHELGADAYPEFVVHADEFMPR